MSYIFSLAPIAVFIVLFLGSGLYFTAHNIKDAFYQISPLAAMMPALVLGWLARPGTTEERMHAFLDGARHRDVMTMCMIFILAGALSEVTQAIGSVEATVNLALTFIPTQYALIGLFLISAFIATSIGSSMGTIATVAPLASALGMQAGLSPALSAATVVGGAMFGDNLSIVSDTTIAAVMSQKADTRAKLKLNAQIACVASIITIVILLFYGQTSSPITVRPYSLVLVFPYVLLIVLACIGVNVFNALVVTLGCASVIGWVMHQDCSVLFLSQKITRGFSSMHEIVFLSLMIGGLSGLTGHRMQELAHRLSIWIIKRRGGPKMAQYMIAIVVSVFDLLLANNTIAIIFSGDIAKEISHRHHIPAHTSAVWLDTFSCVVQGVIPYGAQILMASAIMGVSPLMMTPYVFYCYVLGVVSIVFILCHKKGRLQ